MDETTRKVLTSATRSLVLLSKMRCVREYSFSKDHKFKNLYSWPSKFDADPGVLSFLSNKGINQEIGSKVKSYQVSYSQYKSYENICLKEIEEIRVCRSILHIHQIMLEGEGLEVRAVWDVRNFPDRPYPKSMSDIDGLAEFSVYRDSMLIFKPEDSSFYIKLPGFSYRSLLIGFDSIRNKIVQPEDRSESVGNLVDSEGRGCRYVVHYGNRGYLFDVVNKTKSSVEKLINNGEWVAAFKDDAKNYLNLKKTAKKKMGAE